MRVAMKVQCPGCSAVYNIDDSKIPDQGKHGRCTKCGRRFLISKKAAPKAKKPSRPSANRKPAANRTAAAVRPKPRPKEKPKARPTDWQESKYNRLYKHIHKYYVSKDQDFRFYISSFCFAYKSIESEDYIRQEVAKLRALTEENRATALQAQAEGNQQNLQALQIENNRYRCSLAIFREILAIRRHFAEQGMTAGLNEIYTVLRDVDLAYVR